MREVLSKPIDEITIADIESLIDEGVPEGERIEFKREPPARNGGRDRWMTHKDGIGNHARNTILEGVTAFANAYGGVFLIGIEESKKKPSVATKIFPVPRCADLADRLKSVFHHGVDPQLTRIEIEGIPTEDESGVVILRVGGRSRLAPHRVETTLVCPIRRGDQCHKMSMREIQEMTLNVSRGLERLEKRLSERSKRFREEFDRLSDPHSAFGIRFTAVPVVDEIGFNRVFQRRSIVEGLNMPWGKVKVIEESQNGQRELENTIPAFWPSSWPPSFWRPLLRGARATTSYDTNTPDPSSLPYRSGYQEIYCDGLLELGYLSITDENDKSSFLLDPDWPIVMFANLAMWADLIRKQAGAPTVEYALEVETYNRGNAGFVGKDRYFERNPKLPNEKFPRYPLNDPDEITELLTWFRRDFWNSMGEDLSEVNFILSS
ncbi:MAG: ATP-binding protein [Truepera sp.]|nr:ATP-binding protein [Truepera sp.]